MTGLSPAISIENASVRFGSFVALDQVSLAIPMGSCFGLLGESGSGKTTLMRAILGLQGLESGHIRIMGDELRTGPSGVRMRARRVQAMLQDPVASLSPRRRIGQLLDEVAGILGEPLEETRARTRALFERVGLPTSIADKYPHQISGGQARRVAAIRALLMRPRILFADEPTAGLDVSVQGDLLNLLQELRTEHDLTLAVVSHNLAVVRMIADIVAVMHRGRIVEIGPVDQVFEAPATDYTRQLIAAWPRVARR